MRLEDEELEPNLMIWIEKKGSFSVGWFSLVSFYKNADFVN